MQTHKEEELKSGLAPGLAAAATALAACAACCSLPLLAGLGGALSARAAALASGGELWILGAALFLGALAAARLRRGRTCAGGEACRADGGCCGRGARRAS